MVSNNFESQTKQFQLNTCRMYYTHSSYFLVSESLEDILVRLGLQEMVKNFQEEQVRNSNSLLRKVKCLGKNLD